MSSKNKSIIASFIIIVTVLTFTSLSIVSLATPNLSKEMKKDISKGLDSLCGGNIKDYYNLYNTRKLTEIDKTKFYDKINSTQDIISSEKDLFKNYKLSINVKDVSIIKKLGDKLYLCNIEINYKHRKKPNTTEIVNSTNNYIVKIIDVGNMDYKVLLPFNSLDKDFSSGTIYKNLESSAQKKQAKEIEKQRELEEKLKAEEEKLKAEEEKNSSEQDEHNAEIIEDNLDINQENIETPNNENNPNTENNTSDENNDNSTNNNPDKNNDSGKSEYESFLEN